MAGKKLLAMLMMVTIVLSAFAGCSPSAPASSTGGTESAQEPAGDESSKEEGSEAGADDIMGPYTKYPETVELHTAKVSSTQPKFLPGDSVDSNPMTKYILDRVNVKTITDWEVDITEYPNKLSLMLATDNLPDMFALDAKDYLLYRQMVENDMLADLTEVYDKTVNDHLKGVIDSYNGECLDPFREGDKLFGIGGGQYGGEQNLLWLRKDWMEECGIKETPKTVEDLKKVLVAFKEKNPGGQNVGMVLHFKDIAGGYGFNYSAEPIFGAFGAIPKTWIKDKNGEVVYGSVAPEMKEGLRTLAEWYAEGLIDPQFATRTADGATQAVFTGGQSGAAFAPWWVVYGINDLPVQNPKADLVAVNCPLDAEGKYNVAGPKPAGSVLLVNKNCKNPEAVAKVLNCEFDMWLGLEPEGKELIEPTRANGVSWTYLFPTGGVNFTYSTIISDVGLLCQNLVDNGKMEGKDTATEQDKTMAQYAKDYADTKDPNGPGWAEYYGRYLASNIVATPEVNVVKPAFAYTTESMADLKPNLDTLEQTTFLKIVTGELPVDAFDQFVTDWYAQGGQTMTDEVKAMVKE